MTAPTQVAIIAAALAAAAAPTALASEPTATAEPGGGLTLAIENDFFATTDRHYSNGIALHYSFAPSDTPALSRWVTDSLLGVNPDAYVRTGIAIGHTIYTPEDTDAVPAPPDQHPYAGYLFLRGTLLIDHGNIADALALDIGLVGPAAGGEAVQNNFHDLINDDPSRGWDSQIENEPILNLTASRRWRVPLAGDENGFGVDAVPMVAGSFGNFRIEAAAGATFRIGQALSGDYGPLRVQPSLFSGSLAGRPRDFSWYVFVGAAGRAVAHDITLDGNTYRESASVERKPLVGEVSAGLVLRIDDVKLSYSFVASTPRFEGTGASHRYASINLTIGF